MEIKFIEQSIEYLGLAPSNEQELLKMIETAGRTAYASQDKITDNSAIKFVSHMRELNHFSTLEFSNIVVEIEINHNDIYRDIYQPFITVLFNRGTYHRIVFKTDSKIVISGSYRTWIESINELIRYGQKYQYIESEKLGKYLSSQLAVKYPLLKFSDNHSAIKFINTNFNIVNENEQMQLLNINKEIDLPIFIFRIITDRATSHQIVRHRVMSYLQMSQRYIDSTKKGFIFIKPNEYELDDKMIKLLNDDCELYSQLKENNLKSELARDYLPNLTMTELIMAGRLSGFKHFINLRDSNKAQNRIHQIANEIKNKFSELNLI